MSNLKDTFIEHPMEEVLNIEPGTTLLSQVERSTDLVIAEEYDEKDQEIENQFQEVYDAAMSAFESQSMGVELADPKYRARNHEVAVQYLNTALSAVKEKSTMKQHKDKVNVDRAKAGPKTLNQNVIIADRNDLLKRIVSQENETD